MNSILVYGYARHVFICRCAFGLFLFLVIINKAFMNIHIPFLLNMCFHFSWLNIKEWMDWLDTIIGVYCWLFKKLSNCFPKWVVVLAFVLVHSYQQCIRVAVASLLGHHLVYGQSLEFLAFLWTCSGLICPSLMTSDVEYLFMSFIFCNLYIFEVSVQNFCSS